MFWSKNGGIPQIYQVRDWVGSTDGPIRSPLRILNGAILGKVSSLSADVQYLLRVNGRLGSSCKGNEWFDENSGTRYNLSTRGVWSFLGVKSLGASSGCSNELQTK